MVNSLRRFLSDVLLRAGHFSGSSQRRCQSCRRSDTMPARVQQISLSLASAAHSLVGIRRSLTHNPTGAFEHAIGLTLVPRCRTAGLEAGRRSGTRTRTPGQAAPSRAFPPSHRLMMASARGRCSAAARGCAARSHWSVVCRIDEWLQSGSQQTDQPALRRTGCGRLPKVRFRALRNLPQRALGCGARLALVVPRRWMHGPRSTRPRRVRPTPQSFPVA